MQDAQRTCSCNRITGVSPRFLDAFHLRLHPCPIRKLGTTQSRVGPIDTRCGCWFFGVGFVVGDAGDNRVCWAPAKEWTTRATVKPALAAFPSFEAVTQFPKAAALSSRVSVAARNVVHGTTNVNWARYRNETETHDQAYSRQSILPRPRRRSSRSVSNLFFKAILVSLSTYNEGR